MTIPVAADIWRKYAIAGVPASGPNQPSKADIIAWGTLLETLLSGAGSSLAYSTLASLSADLAHPANTLAMVYGDATGANNGMYIKLGASGVGSWTRAGDLPTSLVRLTVSGGTGNAIVATAPESPTLPGNKLYLLTPGSANTGATTIIVNGAPAVAIKNALGASVAANSLLADLPVLMAWQTDHYQILVSVPVDATGVLNDALAAAAAASASATAAASSASALGNQVHQYDTRTLAIAATVPGGVNLVRTLGYAAAGDGGAALYKRVGSQPSHAGKLQSADGAWFEIAENALSCRMFGAVDDATANSGTAVRNAVATSGVLRTPLLVDGLHGVDQDGANLWCVNVTEDFWIEGQDADCGFVPLATVGSTVDTIRITPNPAKQHWGCGILNLSLGHPDINSRYGRHGINIDTNIAGAYLGRPIFERLHIGLGANATSYGIMHTNSNNGSGGVFGLQVQKCRKIWGGVRAVDTGDSAVVSDNVIYGPQIAIFLQQTNGATLASIERNTTDNGDIAVHITAGPRTQIRDNNFEQSGTGANTAVIYLSGSLRNAYGSEITGNHVSAPGNTNITALIRLDNASGCLIDQNVLLPPAVTTWGINLKAAAVGTRVGKQIMQSGGAGLILDEGATTKSMGVVFYVGASNAPAFLNSWVNYNASYQPAHFWKDENGVVHLGGVIKSGTLSQAAFALPAGYQPSKIAIFTQSANASFTEVRIQGAGDGSVIPTAGSATFTSLEGISFMASDEGHLII